MPLDLRDAEPEEGVPGGGVGIPPWTFDKAKKDFLGKQHVC